MTRYAILRTKDDISVIRRYLPSNFEADYLSIVGNSADDYDPFILIHGFDVAGWTMTDYVIPRLNSGNYYPKEI